MINSKDSIVPNPFDTLPIFDDFIKNLSTYITAFSLTEIINKTKKSNFNYFDEDPILLKVCDEDLFENLKEFSYDMILEKVCRNLTILKQCYDIFVSEIQDIFFYTYIDLFNKLKKDIKINICNDGYIIKTSAMISDLILLPIAKFHSDVTVSLTYFSKWKNYFKNTDCLLFLNAKGPTMTSLFVETWIANQLKINRRPNTISVGVI